MDTKYRNDAMFTLNETKTIDKQTISKFDEPCLTPTHPLSPEEIKDLRTHENVSQAVFTYYLNVTRDLISK